MFVKAFRRQPTTTKLCGFISLGILKWLYVDAVNNRHDHEQQCYPSWHIKAKLELQRCFDYRM
jgi:hypothetical protein